jgi:hypothetical protein
MELMQMKRNRKNRFLHASFILLTGGVIFSGCASHVFRFADSPPVWDEGDRQPVAVPDEIDYEKTYYYFNNIVRRPIINTIEAARIPRAGDVNSVDEVPASSWFTPRLGYKEVSPDELLHGVEIIGPPVPPFTIVRAKTSGSNPGFFAEDSRGQRYLVKFDPREFPAIETTTALIVNRLFWSFGYNVPEDYLVILHREDLSIAPGCNLSSEQLADLLSRVAESPDGSYRCTFSTFLKGEIIGPPPESGVRKDDPNDRIPHENRRTLRAMHVFGAFLNHADIRIDNALDVYTENEGQGFVKHYLLDFGEAFGGHAAEHDWLWDGHEHSFNFNQVWGNLFTLGLNVKAWENIEYTPWKSVGPFESEVFDPTTWKETYQFLPNRLALPDDDYWAAKVVAALDENHIRVLIRAALYPEPEAEAYIVRTLMERRRKIIDSFFRQVSPIEYEHFSNGELELRDLYSTYLDGAGGASQYEVVFSDDRSREVATRWILNGATSRLTIPVPVEAVDQADGYLRIDVRVHWEDRQASRAAQFHFRGDTLDALHLVGVVH